jgi:hypothetical protein
MGTARKEKSGESKGYQAHGMSWSLALASANFVMVWSINRGIFLKSWRMGNHVRLGQKRSGSEQASRMVLNSKTESFYDTTRIGFSFLPSYRACVTDSCQSWVAMQGHKH